MISATSAEPDPEGSILFVGRDAAGHWLVQGCEGQLEGRFIARRRLGFARAEFRGFPRARIVAALRPLIPAVSFEPFRPDECAIDRAD
ncbi:hypothetical protein SKP52_16070 [Sphingopyxis fribergensis]|uniref:Uncharacterized protein n=1 Tax=Sphingopyxis fribergensis TaxID=1515612 RepID=A0A0A7PJD0_9SPHN|nr:hypothetical protein [Sphingopyxis fribergensis]AJA10089.1 hypothetical protein SKP52_16070 [Sphingopyxis fribergensis]